MKDSYYFVKTTADQDFPGYALPLSLVQVVKVNDDSTADVIYQHGSTYDGKWQAWLMAGPGQHFYTEKNVPYESVVLADVRRGKGAMVRGKEQHGAPYYLHKET